MTHHIIKRQPLGRKVQGRLQLLHRPVRREVEAHGLEHQDLGQPARRQLVRQRVRLAAAQAAAGVLQVLQLQELLRMSLGAEAFQLACVL